MPDERATRFFRPHWSLAAVAIVALTLAAYLPVMTGEYEFLWDDLGLITHSRFVNPQMPPHLTGAEGLRQLWASKKPMDYWPLTSTTFWLEWRIWGRDATGYHITNVLLHAINAVLVWVVLKRLKVPAAWLAAAVFAVHPVCVASAAWISERKNTLSMVFFLLTVLAYLRFDDAGRRRWYFLSLAAFLAAMLSKASVATLPVVLLGIVWWRHGRVRLRRVLGSLPFFAVSVGLGLVTIAYQHQGIGSENVRPEGPLSRVAAAGWAVWFYIYKAIVPFDLMLTYPRWDVDAANVLSFVPSALLAAALAVLAVQALRRGRKWARAALFALGYFVVTLAPALGLLDMSWHKFSLVADHFQYLSIVGVPALVVGGAASLLRRRRLAVRAAAVAAWAIVVVLFAVLTARQQRIYKNDETLFTDTLAKNPRSWLAHEHLGYIAGILRANEAAARGQTARQRDLLAQAVRHHSAALEIHEFSASHTNLALALEKLGRTRQAERHYRRAIEMDPAKAQGYYRMGSFLQKLRRRGEAIAYYRLALEREPDYIDAHNSLGNVLYESGKIPEAVEQYRQVLRLDPDNFFGHMNLGAMLGLQDKFVEAIRHLHKAAELNGNSPQVFSNLGATYDRMGRPADAVKYYARALQLADDNQTRSNLAMVLLKLNRHDEAVTLLVPAVRRAPHDAVLRYHLGLALAAGGRLDEAIGQFDEALRLRPNFPAARKDRQGALDRKAQDKGR